MLLFWLENLYKMIINATRTYLKYPIRKIMNYKFTQWLWKKWTIWHRCASLVAFHDSFYLMFTCGYADAWKYSTFTLLSYNHISKQVPWYLLIVDYAVLMSLIKCQQNIRLDLPNHHCFIWHLMVKIIHFFYRVHLRLYWKPWSNNVYLLQRLGLWQVYQHELLS